MLLLVAFGGHWIYGAYFASPSPLPLPRSSAIAAHSSSGSWPVTEGDLGRSRKISALSHIDGAEVWRTHLGASPSTPIVGDSERLYLGLTDGRLAALSTAEGTELWERSYVLPLHVAPTVAGDRLYVIARSGSQRSWLESLDAATGEIRWRLQLDTEVRASPLVDHGTIYVFGQDELLGVAAETGYQLWHRRVATDWALYDSPLISPVLDGDYFAVATGNRILVFDRLTGEQSYWLDLGSFPQHLVLEGGTLYGLSARFVIAIDPTSSRPWWDRFRRAWFHLWVWGFAKLPPSPPHEWASANPPSVLLEPTIDNDRLYAAGTFLASARVVAYQRSNGDTIWEREVESLAAAPVRTEDGLLLIARHALFVLDPEDGRELAYRALEDLTVRWAIPMSHGTYIVTEDGDVLVLR